MPSYLTTRGLVLRPLHLDFIPEDYSRWLNDPEVVKYSELRHKSHTWGDCREYFASFDNVNSYLWSIYIADQNCHIGNITLHIDQNDVGQIGLLIGEKWAWGRGFGSEAWKAVMIFADETKQVRKIEAGCMASNRGMRNIMENCGMKCEAVVPSHFLLDGKPEALVIYGAHPK